MNRFPVEPSATATNYDVSRAQREGIFEEVAVYTTTSIGELQEVELTDEQAGQLIEILFGGSSPEAESLQSLDLKIRFSLRYGDAAEVEPLTPETATSQ